MCSSHVGVYGLWSPEENIVHLFLSELPHERNCLEENSVQQEVETKENREDEKLSTEDREEQRFIVVLCSPCCMKGEKVSTPLDFEEEDQEAP